jgi:hypothetical protein
MDEEVVDVVRNRLHIDDIPELHLIVDEARHAMSKTRANSAQLVVIDAYDGPRAAVSLLTSEAITEAERVLRRGGVLVANVADRAPFDFLRPVLATLQDVFAHVALLADPGSMRGRRYWNQVLVASQQKLPLDDLRRRVANRTPPARLVAGERLTEFVGDATPSPTWPLESPPQQSTPPPRRRAHVFATAADTSESSRVQTELVQPPTTQACPQVPQDVADVVESTSQP